MHAWKSLLFVPLVLLAGGCLKSDHRTGLRVAVFGIDGATWDLVDPWIDEGFLPNLKRLRDEGYSAGLQSVVPPLSAPAWTTAITGVNPGRHGIFNFTVVDRQRFAPLPTTSLNRKAKAAWEYLTESGRRSVVIAVPLTAPPDSVNGVMIAGFPHVFQSKYTYPPEVERELERNGYRLHEYGEFVDTGSEEAYLQRLTAVRESHFRAGLEFYKRKDWDLFWLVFMSSDKVQHFFWKYMDAENRSDLDPKLAARYRNTIRAVFVRIDEEIGEYLAATDENTVVFVVSDHGFGPIYREMQMLKWLWDEGYCDPDPTKSRVLYFPRYGGELTVNRTDRFPNGVVEPGAPYDSLLAELKEKLLAVRDPDTGARVVSSIFRSDEIYSGPHVEDSPDLLFLPERGYFFGRGSPQDGNGIFDEPAYTFSAFHEMRGIFIARGPHVRRGRAASDLRLLDLAPTVLRVLGETIPVEMDGRPFEGPFDDGFADAAPLHMGRRSIERAVSGSMADEARERLEKIEALPYLQ